MGDTIETDSSKPRAKKESITAAAAATTTTPNKHGVATAASVTANSTIAVMSPSVEKMPAAVIAGKTPASSAADKISTTSTPTSSVPDFVKVRKSDWDLLVAKVQKLDKQRIAEVQLLANMQEMEKKNKVLEQTVAEYEKAYLRSERNYADILRVQGFAIPKKLAQAGGNKISMKSLNDPMDLHESKLPYQLPKEKYDDSEIQTDGAVRKDTAVLNKDNLKSDVSRSKSGESSSKIDSGAFVPRIDVLLRESSRPDSWYTSWRITPDHQIGVSKSTFESLAQEYAHLQQQMTKLSGQKGFDLKTNLELQESVHQLQMVLEQKDAVIQQLKAKVTKADAIVAKRNTLIEAYSLECARLQAENQKLQISVNLESHNELQNSASLPSQINAIVADKERVAELQNTVSSLQNEIRELKAKIDGSERRHADVTEKLVWSERRNRDLEEERKRQQARIEQLMQENRTLTKANMDMKALIEDLKKQLASSEELVSTWQLQVNQYEEDYKKLQQESKRDQTNYSNLAEMYHQKVASLTEQLNYHTRRQEMSRSFSAGQCAADVVRDNDLQHHRPNWVEVDASQKKSLSDATTTPVSVNKNQPSATIPMATSTPRQAVQTRVPLRHDGPESGYGTLNSGPLSGGMCPNCDVVFNNEQKFKEHCRKCVQE